MSTETQHDGIDADLRQTIADIDDADASLEHSLLETPAGAVALSPAAVANVNESRMELLRTRARNERERGKKNLEQRYAGVAAVMASVKLNERTVASSFERWFPGTENGIYALQRRGPMVIGEARTAKLVESLDERITQLEADTEQALAIAKQQMQEAKRQADATGIDLMIPTYAQAAAAHEVQLRTRTSMRVLNVFKKQDEIMVLLVQLSWNDAATEEQIIFQADQIKKGQRDLVKFLQRTVRGLKKNVTVDEPGADNTANDTPATSAANSQFEAVA